MRDSQGRTEALALPALLASMIPDVDFAFTDRSRDVRESMCEPTSTIMESQYTQTGMTFIVSFNGVSVVTGIGIFAHVKALQERRRAIGTVGMADQDEWVRQATKMECLRRDLFSTGQVTAHLLRFAHALRVQLVNTRNLQRLPATTV